MSTPQPADQTKLQELAARVIEIDITIKNLDDDYASLASDFPNNNALRRAAGIEARVTDLRREKALAIAAQTRIEQEQKAKIAEAAHAAQRERSGAAKQIAEQIMRVHEAIDAQLQTLAAQCAERVGLLAALGRTDLVDPQLIMKLAGRGPVTRAFCAANLHVHVELQAVSPQGRLPLSSCNQLLASVGRDGNSQPTRARLGNGS
jgi:hypothetical protein